MTELPHRLAGCSCCNDSAPTRVGAAVSRRNFIAGGVAALGLGATATNARAQAPAKPRIDVHHHYLPPIQREALLKGRGGGGLPQWTVQTSLDDMDTAGIAT